ncbi:MAG: hypothetical protein ACAI34_09485 [Verrucomicrobium sp.]|nr:hypothetical protein [Verrucomicrobium sp.]
MLPPPRVLFLFLCAGVTPALLLLTACRDDSGKKGKAKPGQIQLQSLAAPKDAKSKEIEAFTGAHTRLVWTQCAKLGASDTFATSDVLQLVGIDTRNGLGIRPILEKAGNYSRPLISADGNTILYTDKNTARKGGKKHYKPFIYQTDWAGAKPKKISDGYATQCWLDPATGIQWVYAVQNLRPSKSLSLEGQRLVRFQLEDPTKVEPIYDDTFITPDNIQFSRNGTRASALFPWPNAGILRQENGIWEARKLLNGCWTAHSPDNSGLSWVFDGEHKSVTMYADDGEKSWPLKFNDAPGVKGREMYHPRWTNHARFITLTGPYSKEKNSSGNVINKGGSSAEIYLGHLSPGADKVENWLRVTKDKTGEAYPDVWIEGSREANLVGYSIPSNSSSMAGGKAWPTDHEGLLFLWRDREALNAFRDRTGQKLEARIDSKGAGRFGRFNEMVLDGGSYDIEEDAAAPVLEHFRKDAPGSFEAILLPPENAAESTPATVGHVVQAPGFDLQITPEGRIAVGQASGLAFKSTTPLPATACHLVVTREDGKFAAWLNGQALTLEADPAIVLTPNADAVIFGGGWRGGLLQVALHDHAIPVEKIAAHAESAQARIASLPAAPPRVKLLAKLSEVSAMPTPEGIEPYTSSLVAYVYDVEKVLEGTFPDKQILVKHWGMLGLQPVAGFPREVGKAYELVVERQASHGHLNGERVMDDTTAFDLEPWFDVTSPKVVPAP